MSTQGFPSTIGFGLPEAGLPREFVIHILKSTDAYELSRSLYIVDEAIKGEDHCRSTD
jgi:hypothetical protein